MKTRLYIFLFCSLFFLFGFWNQVEGSHIRAGEITAVKVNNTTYTFTLSIYANWYSSVRDDYALINFGDGTSQSVFFNFSEVLLSGDTYRRTYIITKTYAGNGTYLVSYVENFRNAGIDNMTLPDNTPFYVETFVLISPFITLNNPVQTSIPPIDNAAVGKLFIHNPGAYDPDGDSISFKLITPSKSAGVIVDGYFIPPYSTSLTLNSVTGDLIWNSPTQVGLYNIAFIIEEWRKGADGTYSRIGFVTRDMQINVVNTLNNPPVVQIPADTCVPSGSLITKTIRATDPDGNQLTLTAFPSNYFTVVNPQNTPASGLFSWQTNCSHVRDQPYLFTFKAEDRVSKDTLTDFKTWQIRVKGAKPLGLVTTPVGNGIALSWSPYGCSNAEKMEIYRSVCDSVTIIPSPCSSGIPGYVKIGEVTIGTTFFYDNNSGVGLARGVKYCYMLIAKFPLPFGGESYPSDQSCNRLKIDAPVLTNVSVIESSYTQGEILVDWLAPIETTATLPYAYNLYRSYGIDGTDYTLIEANITPPFTDNGLNTIDSAYTYKVEIIGGEFSNTASSTKMDISPANNQLVLDWSNDVPWKEDSVYLYRSVNGGNYQLLEQFFQNPNTHIDSINLKNCDTVCYYLVSYSSFCDDMLPDIVYENKSHIGCGIPADERIPQAPTLNVNGCEGDITVFENHLSWTDATDILCSNIRAYKIYFSEYDDSELQYFTTVNFPIKEYVYENLITTAGCFAVSAVNAFGVEGEIGNKVCVDDCIYYELPNLVTPNGDSLNDLFRPFPIPRGVELVNFKVYNRWGGLVYSGNQDINLNWNSHSSDGEPLSDGIYYFSAEVKYYRRRYKKDETQLMKGWVQILDNSYNSNPE